MPEPEPQPEPQPPPQPQPKHRSRTKNIENEKPLPAQTNTKPSAAGRKPKSQVLETPGRDIQKARRSLRNVAAGVETTREESLGSDKPLTVPLAAIEDTPLVRKKNKEMREAKGHRRSSLGLRGRRASSLSNGFIGMEPIAREETQQTPSLILRRSAAPHPDVQPGDFYKHLDPQMIETQRMQQLLAWCSKCALSEKKARGRDAQSNARAAGKKRSHAEIASWKQLTGP